MKTAFWGLVFLVGSAFVDGQDSSGAYYNSDVPSSYNTRDIGRCVCDITAAKCDPNCCCDTTDCTEAEIAAFQTCLPEGPADDGVVMCSSSEGIFRTNHVNSKISNGQLCVMFENNPYRGKFFVDVVSVDPVNFDSNSLPPRYLFSDTPQPLPTVAQTSYRVGERVIASVGTSAGFLSLPMPNMMGTCTDGNPALFMVDVQKIACTRPIGGAMTAALCDSLSYEKYTNGVVVAPSPSSAATVVVQPCADAACASNSSLQLPSLANSSTVCANAVAAVHYVVELDGLLIVRVKAVFALGSVSGSFSQSFSVEFVKQGVDSTAVSHRSGNPGYIVGLPVILGSFTSATSLFEYGPRKLLGADSLTGGCVADSGPTISFGEDIVGGCLVPLPASTADCLATRNSIMKLVGYGNQSTHVHAWGNASSAASDDWIKLAEVPLSAMEDCTFITEVEFRFMVARQGSLGNPQNRIVSGRTSYKTKTLAELSRCTGRQCSSPTARSFAVRGVVSFVQFPDDGLWTEFVLRPPPALPRLPDDILYPFRFSADALRISSGIVSLVLPLLAIR